MKTRLGRLSTGPIVTVMIGFSLWCHPASAQQAGIYEGFSADGEPIAIEVVPNPPFTFKLNGAAVYFRANCMTSGKAIYDADGFQLARFVSGDHARFTSTNHVSYRITAHLTFHGKKRITGTIESWAPAFFTLGKHPSGSELCISPNQKFEATIPTAGERAAFSAKYAAMNKLGAAQ